MRTLYGLGLGLLMAVTSCKNGGDPVPAGPTFDGKTYRIVSYTLNPAADLDGDGKADTDLTILMDDCVKDNTATLETGGKVKINFGTVKCASDGPATQNGGTWSYDTTKNVLKTVDNDNPTKFTEWQVSEGGNTLRTTAQFVDDEVTYTTTMIMKTL